MDGTRFDDLTRRIATGVSRRGFLRGTLAALTAGGLTRASGAAAACTNVCPAG